MSDLRQYTPATQRNRQPILEVLARVLPERGDILEISSGTGEHPEKYRDTDDRESAEFLARDLSERAGLIVVYSSVGRGDEIDRQIDDRAWQRERLYFYFISVIVPRGLPRSR